ncbi:hypothetical protein VW23_018850 [Devosia insulae DS-56]|uniref:DUF1491 domain-containing protein n=1 Tax=Devosia insulae DS-56 TaxID=1116389 RepID=A0A1E5XQR5_9HYPH|nr:DUF1491 family protein [Devosia insulae]OEO30938.1 hypothetical protein VW23_018850 [Devosia insulae DS-56]
MFRTDLWVSAFVRRHNDIGHLCVVSRRGDPIAGQIFVEVDHLNGEVSLYTPAPATSLGDNPEARVFQLRFDHVEPAKVRERIEREYDFDPDLWVVSLELRKGELGLEVART